MTRKALLLLALAVLTGCATTPSGPSVRVLPGPNKPFEQFVADDNLCRNWASQQIGEEPGGAAHTAKGAGVGTLIGAGAGALIGAAAGSPGMGAAIGGGSGLMLGSAAGAGGGATSGQEAQIRYDNAYVQCMYAKGNQVPGVRYSAPPTGNYPVPPDYHPPR